MTPFKLKEMIPTEAQEARSLLQWASTQRWNGKGLCDLLVMIPNGAYLGGDIRQRAITMASLKRQGFRAGVSDYFLAIPTKAASGLWLELKRQKLGVVSDEQKEFHLSMSALGYAVAICKGWEAAKDTINNYLQGASSGQI